MSRIYMTESEAAAHGFTHHGKMFSVPCWIGPPDDAPMVAPKFAPLELWISICTLATQFMGMLGADVAFPLMIGPEITGRHPESHALGGDGE